MAAYTTIDDPSAYFKVQLYTGNGSANHAITFDDTDTDMQPDFVWIKNTEALAGDSHCLFDALRGATEVIHSDTTAAEATDADTLDSFASDGFQVDADVKVNTNAEDYVAWCWKANGTGSSNTSGTINTTATSANTTAGFSIITYTGNGTAGATIGHGLGAVPNLIIPKTLSHTGSWPVFHTSHGETKFLELNNNGAVQTGTTRWNDTAPTSTLISLGTTNNVNGDSRTYVAYVWTDIQGFSKFGSYVGNGNDEGPFVYTGFRPAFLMRKTAGEDYWHIVDNKRLGYNPRQAYAVPNDTVLNDALTRVDLLSNGFKVRDDDSADNTNGTTYIYAAFAEAPFVNSEGVPGNAR